MPTSTISGKEINISESVRGQDINAGIFELIKADHPGFDTGSYISFAELNTYRRQYLAKTMEQERGELNQLDQDVMNTMRKNEILSGQIKPAKTTQSTLGERVADKIASFGGSWTFIIIFFTFLLAWMAVNTWLLVSKPFDPYPFILLNLILSCLAAIQAPIIMMSQNRQEQKDRERAEADYKINLKAELEIKLLSEKIDHLLVHQNKKLLELQQIQIDYLENLEKRLGKS